MQPTIRFIAFLVASLSLAAWFAPARVAVGQSRFPTARLIPATTITFPSLTDSNSPAVWELVDGRLRLFVFNSESGLTNRAEGSDLSRLASHGLVNFDGHPGHGVWIEGIVPDIDGVWYGFYHHEAPAEVCGDLGRTIPRIGAVRSHDFGATWADLGIVLEAPRGTHDCDSSNQYFVGGVGDFSVMLDHAQQYLYIFFSQYASRESVQGVSVARMAWADRDAPVGKVSVWLRNQSWLPSRMTRMQGDNYHIYPAGSPIYRAVESWQSATADAFWGPSVHWNTYLERYVMLLNRAQDAAWTQEGVYVAYASDLADPAQWSAPERLIAGGGWYPQVLGIEPGTGTDRLAGERARFFIHGRSRYIIQFSK